MTSNIYDISSSDVTMFHAEENMCTYFECFHEQEVIFSLNGVTGSGRFAMYPCSDWVTPIEKDKMRERARAVATALLASLKIHAQRDLYDVIELDANDLAMLRLMATAA